MGCALGQQDELTESRKVTVSTLASNSTGPQFDLCCCDKCRQLVTWRGKAYLAYRLLSIIKGWQGSNLEGRREAETMQEAASCFALCGWLSLRLYTTQHHPTQSRLDTPITTVNQENAA